MEPSKKKQKSLTDFFRARTADDGPVKDNGTPPLPSTSAPLRPIESITPTINMDEIETDEAESDSVDIVPAPWDIGVVASGQALPTINNTQKYHYLSHQYDGKQFATYEVVKKGKKVPLTFQASWLKEFGWLTYSPSMGGGYCKYCVLFAKPQAKVTLGTLVKTPFRNFSKAKGKDGILTNHVSHDYHHEAVMMGQSFLNTYDKPGTRIDSQIDRKRNELSEKNKHVLSIITDTVKLCGMQGLALRGHRDDNTANNLTNRGNFMAILEHTAKTDKILHEHLESGKKNQRYTSKTIQNEIINTIADHLRGIILKPLQVVPYYSIMADEVTDPHGNQEILSLCLRFIDVSDKKTDPQIKEAFIAFSHLTRTTGKAVASAIMELLNSFDLDLQNMRGQSYDGASAMAGEKKGAQALIKEKNPLALFTHCHSHVLSLAIGKSSSVQALRQIIDVINEVYLFFNLSPKRQKYLELVLEVLAPENRAKKLKGLCKTRWTERHDCLEQFHALFEYIATTLHAMAQSEEYPQIEEAGGDRQTWTWDANTLTKAQGLKTSLMNGSNIIALVVLLYGLDPLKGLSAKLQKRNADVVAAYNLIDTAVKEVQSHRTNFDEVWEEWFKEAEKCAENTGSEIKIPRRNKHQKNRDNTPADTASDFYKRTIGIPFMDNLLQQLNSRFSDENRKVQSIMSLVPEVIVGISDPGIEALCNQLNFWEKDMPSPDSLKRELRRWKSFWVRYQETLPDSNLPQDLIATLSHADEDVYPNIRQLVLVGCVFPVGSCEAERSFSVLRRLKTHLRSTMTEERLTGLTMMAVHYTESCQVDTKDIVQKFVKTNPRKLFCQSILFD